MKTQKKIGTVKIGYYFCLLMFWSFAVASIISLRNLSTLALTIICYFFMLIIGWQIKDIWKNHPFLMPFYKKSSRKIIFLRLLNSLLLLVAVILAFIIFLTNVDAKAIKLLIPLLLIGIAIIIEKILLTEANAAN